MKRRSKLLVMMLVFFMLSLSLLAQSQRIQPRLTLKKPDLTILKITVDRNCNLAVVVKNNGPGALPNAVYTNHHPKSAGVFVYINGKSWGGESIWKFDPAKKLQKPGGQATCILNYKVGPSIHVKAVVDLWNDVKEANERNNTRSRKGLSCRGTGGTQGLITPRQISPKNKSHFTHYPRKVTLRWGAVKGAAAYDVEIDCLHCRKSGQWDSQNGPPWKTAYGLKRTGYSFTFVGDNQGRWRVRATRGNLKSKWSSWWYFDFKTKPGTGSARKLPDLIVRDIRLVKNCKIQVTVKNIGTAGVPDSYYDLPNAVGVQMYNGSKPWGGIILKGFDPAGNLKSPGGTATHIWFPKAANLNLPAGTHSLKVIVDHGSVLTELDEGNNSLTRRVTCKRLTAARPIATTTPIAATTPVATTTLPQLVKAPQRFFLDFNEARLVYKPATKTAQIATGNKVLSYCNDWEKCNLRPYLYHFREKFWKGFYWVVNTSRREVYEVTGGSFCKIGGKMKKLNITVDVIGGSDTSAPETIFLRFKNARLVYVPKTKTLQISEGGKVLSYGSDWDKCNLNAFTYHLKNKFAQTFFWKVDTNKKTAVEVTGGTFCKPGGSETPLPFTVTVVK